MTTSSDLPLIRLTPARWLAAFRALIGVVGWSAQSAFPARSIGAEFNLDEAGSPPKFRVATGISRADA